MCVNGDTSGLGIWVRGQEDSLRRRGPPLLLKAPASFPFSFIYVSLFSPFLFFVIFSLFCSPLLCLALHCNKMVSVITSGTYTPVRYLAKTPWEWQVTMSETAGEVFQRWRGEIFGARQAGLNELVAGKSQGRGGLAGKSGCQFRQGEREG